MPVAKPDFSVLWGQGGLITDPGLTKRQEGYVAEIPEYDQFNWLINHLDSLGGYLYEQGVAAWGSTTTYPAGGLAKNANGHLFRSKQANNLNHALPTASDTWWEKVTWNASELAGVFVTKNATATLTALEASGGILFTPAGGGSTLTLPTVNAALGNVECFIRRQDSADANTTPAIIAAAAGQLIYGPGDNGVASKELIFRGDYLRLRADPTSTSWIVVGQAPLPAALASDEVIYDTAGSFTFTTPAVLRTGRVLANVHVRAGGAGGSRGSSPGSPAVGSGAGGGGEGGWAEELLNLTGVTSVGVVVGAGGAGSSTANTPGSNGGASSFGAYLSASGGLASSPFTWGGLGGVGSGGSVNGSGQSGTGGYNITTWSSTALSIGGNGGGLGGGTQVQSLAAANTAGVQATSFGGGGGGSTGAANGGGGLRGIVKISWGAKV